MEKNLERVVEDLMNSPGITGVVCSDLQGLCISLAGRSHVQASAYVSSLATLACQLEGDSNGNPIVVLESDSTNVLIQKKDDIALAIYKHAFKNVV